MAVWASSVEPVAFAAALAAAATLAGSSGAKAEAISTPSKAHVSAKLSALPSVHPASSGLHPAPNVARTPHSISHSAQSAAVRNFPSSTSPEGSKSPAATPSLVSPMKSRP